MEDASSYNLASDEGPALYAPRGPADPRFERLARTAAAAMRATRAAVILRTVKGLSVAASVGGPADGSGTLEALLAGCSELSVTGDAADDPAFAGRRLALPGARFYACSPLTLKGGQTVGLLAVGDAEPQPLPRPAQRVAMEDLAALAAEELQRDIERRRDEEQRETLLAELDHRVKNVLAAVQSMAAQSARKTTSLDTFLKTFAGRLKAMASAHELLTATRWRGAALGNIAAAELGGLAPGQARWEGPEIFLTPRAANAVSLALHELATNAVKFGALSVDSGRVSVNWREREGGGFVLEWLEQGGPSVSQPVRRGFGSTLLEQVTGREIGGHVEAQFRREGVRVVLHADASAVGERPREQEEPAQEPQVEIIGASTGQAPAAAGGVEGLRILIVEDAVLLALELEAGLEEAGAHIVGTAAEVDEAMALLDKPFDAAVLDANLNGRLVTPVAEALVGRGVPFVFATGYGDKAAPEGFDAPIVRKPYQVHQIVRALAEATGRV